MRKTLEELNGVIGADPALAASIQDAYAVATFARDCILPPNFTYPDVFATGIALTEEGAAACDFLTDETGLSEADARAVVLAHLYHHDLLIDLEKSDLSGVASALSNEVRSHRIRYPFVFCRELYDAYFDLFGPERVDLSAEDTQQLLAHVSQGVFQLGHRVSGPLGIVTVQPTRWHRLTITAPMAHCRDPGCQSIHPVTLTTSPTSAGRGYSRLKEHFYDTVGPASPWSRAIYELNHPDEQHYRRFHPGELIWLLGNALSVSELRLVIAGLIDHDRRPYSSLPLAPEFPDLNTLSSQDFVSGVDRASLLQLSLVVDDSLTAEVLDELVHSSRIVVPHTEVRESLHTLRGVSGYWRQRAQLSRLGIRFDTLGAGSARLRDFLRSRNTSDELEWLLVGVEGSTTAEKLDAVLQQADLHATVERLLLRSREAFAAATEISSSVRSEHPTPAQRGTNWWSDCSGSSGLR